MPATEDSFEFILIVGTIIIVVLIIFLFFFVIIYQQKMIANQQERQKLQDEKQNDMLRAVLETQESERERLAEDLHDSVGQVLSAVKLNLHRLDKTCANDEKVTSVLSNTRGLIDDCIQEIRSIIQNVKPPLLTDFGLAEALNDLCNKIQKTTGIQVIFNDETDKGRYEAGIEVTLYRIVQELFSNTIKHANATAIQVNLKTKSNLIQLIFTDNGLGYNKLETTTGSGLKNMQSRTSFIKGSIQITTQHGQGTKAEINVPIV